MREGDEHDEIRKGDKYDKMRVRVAGSELKEDECTETRVKDDCFLL